MSPGFRFCLPDLGVRLPILDASLEEASEHVHGLARLFLHEPVARVLQDDDGRVGSDELRPKAWMWCAF